LRWAHVLTIRPESADHKPYARVLKDFELILQIEGSTWIWSGLDGGSVDLRAGEIAFIPPRLFHSWAHEPGRHIAVHFDLHAKPLWNTVDSIRWRPDVVERKPLSRIPRFAFTEVFTKPDIPSLVLPLVTKLRAPRLFAERLGWLVELSRLGTERSLRGILRAAAVLGWALGAIGEDAAHAGLDERSDDPRIIELVRALDTQATGDLGGRPSVAKLARRAGMSVSTFRDAFVATMGRTPRDFFERRRMESAARALAETDRKILNIARAEGYDDPYHFSRVFRRVMGDSPRRYRRKMRDL
jgi:AraC-like DNA-binding protein